MSVAKLTPMMRQYMLLKEKHPDCILMFRLGDFYEMFFEDAELCSRVLSIALTGRDCGMDERAPMCGVPYHSVDGYIKKLITNGYKVAICEQLTDPKESKGLVERDVIRIITPGTLIETSMLDEQRNNYILALYLEEGALGLAFCDVSTGEFTMGSLDTASETALLEELSRIQPAEIIADSGFYMAANSYPRVFTSRDYMISCYKTDSWAYPQAMSALRERFGEISAEVESAGMRGGVSAAGGLLAYLYETQKTSLEHINSFGIYRRSSAMVLDVLTRRNLELTQPLRGEGKKGTLLGVLDKTKTAMGTRQLRLFIEQPLQSRAAIIERQDAVAELAESHMTRDAVRGLLAGIFDIQRMASRISYGTINARDCVALAKSLSALNGLKAALSVCISSILSDMAKNLDCMDDIRELLNSAIVEDPPLSVRDGGIIKPGYSAEVDELREAASKGREWLAKLEAEERAATGIKTLKIGYNKVFGYYIEVTKSYLSQVPYRYVRKQTLASQERYVTQELKELEDKILGAQEKSVRLEYELFCGIRETLLANTLRLQRTAGQIALLDALQSLATAAVQNGYVRPEINETGEISITDGRHPVVERTHELFVPNDTQLNNSDSRFLIITGPNMAGKSTYMRQVALIALMAHIGSFVPAKAANIAILNRIFTRVGASDDLYSGQSTFMVEMSEMAAILNEATDKSLILLDEIGRGTSTFDGLSIAWAVVEYICEDAPAGAKTLFATHYHELSELEGRLPGVKNYRTAVKEIGDNVIFLRKITRGSADKSFGINVAKLAGLPEKVIARAKEILRQLETSDINRPSVPISLEVVNARQLDIFAADPVIAELADLNLDNMTPIEALLELKRLQDRIKHY